MSPKKHIVFQSIILITALLFPILGITQTPEKKLYTADQDSLWSNNTYIKTLSSDGKWVVHAEIFDHKKDVFTLKQTSGVLTYTFKDCKIAAFSRDSRWFAGIYDNNELALIDLENQVKEVYTDILPRFFSFSTSGAYATAYKEEAKNNDTLLIIDLNHREVLKFSGITDYKWHPVENRLLMIQNLNEKERVVLYDVNMGQSRVLLENADSKFTRLQWSDSGNAAIFMDEQQSGNVLYHWSPKRNLQILNNNAVTLLEEGYQIGSPTALFKPFISKDGSRVLFYREKQNNKAESETSVEVWDTQSPWIYPRMQYYKETKLKNLLTAWYPDTGLLVPIETQHTPASALDINHDYALVYNPLDYEPLYKYSPNADLYIKDMKTGKTRLVCKNQYTEGKFITISPYGKYISYFKENHWWVYDIANDTTINLTEKLPVGFQNTEMERAGDLYPYGNPGWFGRDEHIALYDQYDIWIMSPDGKEKRRITQGKEKHIRYRISRLQNGKDFHKITVDQSFASAPFDTQKGLLLDMFDKDNYKTGYALLQKNNSVKTIAPLEDVNLNNVLWSKNHSIIFYRKQKFNRPIGIYSLDLETNREHLLYQSNTGLLEYDLGKMEIVNYVAPNGKPLKGTLIYPSNYTPNKKYPMIVQIYEQESIKILKFAPPSDYNNMNGFNLLRYTTNGYFVFYPDFTYTIGDPGISALNCLTIAVNKVLETDKVDKERIGLIGHSFGGYETAFIVTQTDMFAAAVAGAAAADAVSWYHDVAWGFKKPQLWRMENQQWRMGDSFYNIKENYYRNSPLQHVENVNTPLLLWTGKLDTNVNWTQSLYMFMALKRLNKKAKMLLFENEPHVVFQKEKNKRLSQEIFSWMETHLKERD